jgi:hypothetical protein
LRSLYCNMTVTVTWLDFFYEKLYQTCNYRGARSEHTCEGDTRRRLGFGDTVPQTTEAYYSGLVYIASHGYNYRGLERVTRRRLVGSRFSVVYSNSTPGPGSSVEARGPVS